MSYSIRSVIEIPSTLPTSNAKFGYRHSNISSQGSSGIPSNIATPNIDTESPYNFINFNTGIGIGIASPSNGNTPSSCSYSIHPFSPKFHFPNGGGNNSIITSPNGKNEIICNTPNTINNATHYNYKIKNNKNNNNNNKKRVSRHKRAHPRPNANKSNSTQALRQSVTPLTPNINVDIAENAFDFTTDTVDITENTNMADVNEEDEKTFKQHLNTKHLNALCETDDNITDNNTDIDVESSESPNHQLQNPKHPQTQKSVKSVKCPAETQENKKTKINT